MPCWWDAVDRLRAEFETFARENRDPLLRHVRGRVSRVADAEDIAQESWVRISAAMAAGAVFNLGGYLYRVARNLLVDHYRREARDSALMVQGESLDLLPATTPDPEHLLLTRDELRRMDAVVRAMPPRARQVFRLARIEGHSHAEIGRRLGISRQTVHEHMLRALVALQEAADENSNGRP
jgi:RNA polymerase sigma-70 factor (ECF subfamily)